MLVRRDLLPGVTTLPPLGLLIDAGGKSQAVSEMGPSTSFKRKPRTPPTPDVSLRRTARRPTKSADARRGAAHGGELRQAAGAAALVAADKGRSRRFTTARATSSILEVSARSSRQRE